MKLVDRVALVTGAASGFGRATAVRLAREGARIVIADLDEGQFVSSYPFESGPQNEDEEGDAEGAEVAIRQTFAQTGPKQLFKAVVA